MAIAHESYRAVPAGTFIIALGACPARYTRVTTLDGRYLTGGATFNAAAGGTSTHTHTASHSHGGSANLNAGAGAGFDGMIADTQNSPSRDTHGHTASVTISATSPTVSTENNFPVTADLVLCQRS